MKNYLLVAALSALVMGCRPAKTEKETLLHIDLTHLFDKEVEKVPLEDWAKNVRFIPLETNDSILIKYILKVILHEDKLLVYHADRASVFDLSGRYLYDIGKLGEGPGEFARLDDIVSSNDLLYIKEKTDRIKVYDWNGKFKEVINIPNMGIRNYYPLRGTDVMVGHTPNLSGKNTNRLVFFRDTTVLAKIENTRIYDQGKIIVVFSNEMQILEGIPNTFKEMFNDTIFQIRPDYTLKPYAVVDLGNYGLPADFRYTIQPETVGENIFKGKVNLMVTGEQKDILYMHHFLDKEIYTIYYDKKEGKVHNVSLVYPENAYEIPENRHFVPRFISEDNRYLINHEQPENEENPVVILVER